MMDKASQPGRDLIAKVRTTVAAHAAAWRVLVPDSFTVNREPEAAEEHAFLDMALAKGELRDHLSSVYGIPVRELFDLATH